MAQSDELLEAIAREPELVDGWLPISGLSSEIRLNKANVEAVANAVKQEGYDGAYFSNLLQ